MREDALSSMSYQPIENYGVIGDLHTVALVGMDGSIDFMCFPHFDSPSVGRKSGCFSKNPGSSWAKYKRNTGLFSSPVVSIFSGGLP